MNDGRTVGTAAVAQARRVITIQDGINHQNVIALRIVIVPLIGYIVEFRELFREDLLVLALLQHILLLIPIPWRINLSKVLNDQIVCLDSFFAFAEDSQSFGMDSEVRIYLVLEVVDAINDQGGKFFLHHPESLLLSIIDDEVKGLSDVKSLFTHLLDGKDQFLLNKLALLFWRDIPGQQIHQIHSGHHVDPPAHTFIHVNSKLQPLLKSHLPVLAIF
mmetsp:Transcript_31136/g.30590  ORF Transcript_31136/g.30590 Transcript_31136/m.30590 type:complete len:218 (-) Transcript_31136:1734-2387(-)